MPTARRTSWSRAETLARVAVLRNLSLCKAWACWARRCPAFAPKLTGAGTSRQVARQKLFGTRPPPRARCRALLRTPGTLAAFGAARSCQPPTVSFVLGVHVNGLALAGRPSAVGQRLRFLQAAVVDAGRASGHRAIQAR
jgi:hypothetical protein